MVNIPCPRPAAALNVEGTFVKTHLYNQNNAITDRNLKQSVQTNCTPNSLPTGSSNPVHQRTDLFAFSLNQIKSLAPLLGRVGYKPSVSDAVFAPPRLT
ncbi:hypothetical protein EVAR_102140_1 [Eumeta japonica]|uniref:Uncharacterized protein n=1 Tax=Eumeta variegata TaxID=151549 RepID=A0A4C1TZV1_EUMVA|nr:hypothetical protein EVAR_102140_1 [Eumeta japonica]